MKETLSSNEPRRELAGIRTPRVGLGCMGMSDFYGSCDQATALEALHHAFDLGYRHFDTANIYGEGRNEQLLRQFLSELGAQRDQVLVATKIGIKRIPGPTPAMAVDSSPAYVRSACDESLQRLGLEQIGLLYLHRRNPAVPIEETVGAMSDLVRCGKARYLGLSEVSIETLTRASEAAQIVALQSEYSLWSRDVEAEILPLCERRGIALVAYSPLGRGFLTGQMKRPEQSDLRAHLPRFQGDNFEANLRLVDSIFEIAGEISARPAQVALAWVLAQSQNIHVIPGSTRSENLAANIASLRVRLTEEHRRRLSLVFHPKAIRGQRYPDPLMKTVNT